MTYIKYKDLSFRQASLDMIAQADEILTDYQGKGHTLTVRQLYYQFVRRNLIENTERSYNKMIATMTKARLAGLISWEAIEDRNRSTTLYSYEESENQVLYGIEYGIRYDYWSRQDHYLEVWVEKDALSGIISKACRKFDVPHMACKGYLSASEAWRAGNRFKEAQERGKNCVLIHLGDHDPSGMDMTRDNAERLDLFTDYAGVDVQRIALNMDQVEHYNPPPNPAKITDTRSTGYIERFGAKSWELDALEPEVLDQLIEEKIKSYIDFTVWKDIKSQEHEARKVLEALGDNWRDIRPYVLEEFVQEEDRTFDDWSDE